MARDSVKSNSDPVTTLSPVGRPLLVGHEAAMGRQVEPGKVNHRGADRDVGVKAETERRRVLVDVRDLG